MLIRSKTLKQQIQESIGVKDIEHYVEENATVVTGEKVDDSKYSGVFFKGVVITDSLRRKGTILTDKEIDGAWSRDKDYTCSEVCKKKEIVEEDSVKTRMVLTTDSLTGVDLEGVSKEHIEGLDILAKCKEYRVVSSHKRKCDGKSYWLVQVEGVQEEIKEEVKEEIKEGIKEGTFTVERVHEEVKEKVQEEKEKVQEEKELPIPYPIAKEVTADQIAFIHEILTCGRKYKDRDIKALCSRDYSSRLPELRKIVKDYCATHEREI